MGSFHGFSMFELVSWGALLSSHIPKLYEPGDVACVHWPSVSECGGVSKCGCMSVPCDGRASCSGWVPTLCPGLLAEALATCDSELE